LTISNESPDYGYIDVKERGGNEDEIRQEIEKLGYVDIVNFHQSDSDKLLTYSKG
jgi:hypothetical protein